MGALPVQPVSFRPYVDLVGAHRRAQIRMQVRRRVV
jgi:hypothetical protein